jgi:hypothetical protein
MAGDLDDVEGIEGMANDAVRMDGPPLRRAWPESRSDKQQAQLSMESRRRLEEKLEETRVKKQMQEYDFDYDSDDDWG